MRDDKNKLVTNGDVADNWKFTWIQRHLKQVSPIICQLQQMCKQRDYEYKTHNTFLMANNCANSFTKLGS